MDVEIGGRQAEARSGSTATASCRLNRQAPREVEPYPRRRLPSPFLTLILTLDDPLVIAAHPDPRQPPGRYAGLLGGLHLAPALITHDGRQSGVRSWSTRSAAVPSSGCPPPNSPTATSRPATCAPVRPEVAHACRRLLRGDVPVAAVAAEVGWSGRCLTGRFRAEVGLRPKEAARVARFDRAGSADMTDPQTPPPQVWPTLRARDARALIRFLVDAFGFEETVVHGDGDRVDHAQLAWPPGGGIMLGSADRGDDDPWALPPGTFGTYRGEPRRPS